MRQLPSAKVCFLGGCPRSGRNQDPHRGAPAKQKTAVPPGADSFAFAVLESESGWKGGTNNNTVDEAFGSMKSRQPGSADLSPQPFSLNGPGRSLCGEYDSRDRSQRWGLSGTRDSGGGAMLRETCVDS